MWQRFALTMTAKEREDYAHKSRMIDRQMPEFRRKYVGRMRTLGETTIPLKPIMCSAARMANETVDERALADFQAGFQYDIGLNTSSILRALGKILCGILQPPRKGCSRRKRSTLYILTVMTWIPVIVVGATSRNSAGGTCYQRDLKTAHSNKWT